MHTHNLAKMQEERLRLQEAAHGEEMDRERIRQLEEERQLEDEMSKVEHARMENEALRMQVAQEREEELEHIRMLSHR